MWFSFSQFVSFAVSKKWLHDRNINTTSGSGFRNVIRIYVCNPILTLLYMWNTGVCVASIHFARDDFFANSCTARVKSTARKNFAKHNSPNMITSNPGRPSRCTEKTNDTLPRKSTRPPRSAPSASWMRALLWSGSTTPARNQPCLAPEQRQPRPRLYGRFICFSRGISMPAPPRSTPPPIRGHDQRCHNRIDRRQTLLL